MYVHLGHDKAGGKHLPRLTDDIRRTATVQPAAATGFANFIPVQFKLILALHYVISLQQAGKPA